MKSIDSVQAINLKKNKAVLGKAPFIRSTDIGKNSTAIMMRDVLIALFPIIFFAWVKNGLLPFINYEHVSVYTMLWPLLFVLTGGLTSFVLEALYFMLFKGEKTLKGALLASKNSFSVLPGIFLALILPLYTPFWMLMLGCFMANIVFKMLFGGFGYNIFNPALIGYVFIIAAFAGSLISNEFNAYYSVGDIFNQTASSTPLTNVMGSATINEETVKFLQFDYDLMVGTYGNLWDFFFGHIPGSLGETSSLLIIISYIYLCIRKTIDWYTPLIYVGVVFALTWGIGAFCGHPDIWYPVFHVCSGGLLFGAVFMATEPVTTPRTPNGKIIFAIFLGLFTVLFRVFGAMDEGVATSILFMCLFSGIIDRFCAKIRVSGLCKQTIGKYALLGTFMLLIVAFIFYKTNSLNPREVLTQTQDLMNNDILLRGGK